MSKHALIRNNSLNFVKFVIFGWFLTIVAVVGLGILFVREASSKLIVLPQPLEKVAQVQTSPAPVQVIADTPPVAPSIVNVTYTCDGKKTIDAIYMNNSGTDGKVELNLSDKRSFLLLQAMSGSGVRYTNSDESVTFWNKGDTAFLEEKNATTFASCVSSN